MVRESTVPLPSAASRATCRGGIIGVLLLALLAQVGPAQAAARIRDADDAVLLGDLSELREVQDNRVPQASADKSESELLLVHVVSTNLASLRHLGLDDHHGYLDKLQILSWMPKLPYLFPITGCLT